MDTQSLNKQSIEAAKAAKLAEEQKVENANSVDAEAEAKKKADVLVAEAKSAALVAKKKEDEAAENKKKADELAKPLTKEQLLAAKEAEIKALKGKLEAAQNINKLPTGDIRKKVNALGDVAKICVGLSKNGQRVFKRADKLTNADIEARNKYIKEIKQVNARKY